MWAEGFTLYGQLNGERHALHAAETVGDLLLGYIRERSQVVQAAAREVGWALIALDGGQLTVQSRHGPLECGYAAGNHISWMGCLQSFAEKGWLDGIQYPDAEVCVGRPARRSLMKGTDR